MYLGIIARVANQSLPHRRGFFLRAGRNEGKLRRMLQDHQKRQWEAIVGHPVKDWHKPPGKAWRPRFARISRWQFVKAWWLGLMRA